MEGMSSIPPTQRRLKFQDSMKATEHKYERYAGLSRIEKRIIANRSSDDPRTSQNIHSRSGVSKGIDVKEHSKCVSRPPSYLGHSNKRGTLQDKAFSVGALNWDHIDKWKQNQGGVVETGSHDSSSASNNSWSSLSSKLYYESYAPPGKQRASITSTVGFVPGEPNRERIVCLLSPQKPISSVLTKRPSTERSISGNYSHLRALREETKGISSLNLKEEELYINSKPAGVYETKKVLDMLQKSRAKNLTQTELYSEIKRTISSMRYVESLNVQKSSTISDHTMESKVEKPQNSSAQLNYQVCPQKNENVFVVLNSDAYSTPSGDILLPESQVSTDEVLESNCSASDVLSERGSLSNHVSGHSQSSPRPHYSDSDGDTSTDPKTHLNAKDIHTVMVLPKGSRSFSNVVDSSDFSCVQGREPIPEQGEFSPVGCSLTSDRTYLDQATQNSRNPSPLRHISNGFSRMRKSLSSKDNSIITVSNSKRFPKSVGVPSSPVVPFKDKSEAQHKARSSPLRRLIDPLLKPKVVITSLGVDDHTGSAVGHKMFDKVSETASKFSLIDMNNKDTVQALLQCSTKNGLPMFKFVAKKKGDTLVATMANTSAHEKPDLSLNFTMYSVNEMTKNSSWRYQGRTGKDCGYLYSIIGQMKFCIPCSNETTGDLSSSKQSSAVESTLFGIQPSKTDQETMKVKPSGELAALILKTSNDSLRIRENGNNCEKFMKEFRECLSDDSSNNMAERCKRLSTTVILPAAVHSMPSKGAPSPLIHRWRSGGSCDCGGWDIGCNLSLLHNENDKACCEPTEQSQKSPASECFRLFSQTGDHGNNLSFRLTPFNKGIYSVDFKPSTMSDIQAFFISITVLSSLVTFDLSKETE